MSNAAPRIQHVAIIGAGSSGLAAARTFLKAGYTVTIFEQDEQVGGRATTRQKSGFIYDAGAQYVKPGSDESISLVTAPAYSAELIDISKPVWIFDQAGHIREGDLLQNAEPKWTYRYGLITLAQGMSTGLDLRLGVAIERIQRESAGWQLFTTERQTVGFFSHLLFALPGPSTIAILQQSQMDDSLRAALCEELAAARYNPLISVVLGYTPRPKERPYYALVNTDKAHAVSWLAWEHDKAPERVPTETGLLIAQMAPHYSREHWHSLREALINDVAVRVSTLVQEDLSSPIFADVDYWPHALPYKQADINKVNTLSQTIQLAFCGDTFTGGRVHLALENGIAVARQMITSH